MSFTLLRQYTFSLLTASVLVALAGCGDDGREGAQGPAGSPGTDGVNGLDGAPGVSGRLTRLATVPSGAEVTGLFLTDNGDGLFNVQHPADTNVALDSINNTPFNTYVAFYAASISTIYRLPWSITCTPERV